MVKSENQFLGILISHMDADCCISVYEIERLTGLNTLQLSDLLSTLCERKYLQIMDTVTIRVTQLGLMAYISPKKRLLQWIASFCLFTIKEGIVFALGVVSGLLVAYFSRILGLG